MKKCALLLAVLAMSTSAWGFGIGYCGPDSIGTAMCPPPSQVCPRPYPNPGAVIGGDFAGRTGLLYVTAPTGARMVDVDSCAGAFSKQGHIGCIDWGCFTSFGHHTVTYGPTNPWSGFALEQ